jgi:hypothetical protein
MWLSITIQVLAGLMALASLWKDWQSYGTISKRFGKRFPILLAILIVFFIIFTIGNTIRQTWDSATQAAKDAGRIEELKNQLENQGKVLDDIQIKVNTDPMLRQNVGLLKEIKDLQGQVKATKASIEKPLEKANLEVTFSESPTLPPMLDQPLMHEIKAIKRTDGTVELIIYIVNRSKVQAKKGVIFIRICKECTFDKEPNGFAKPLDASSKYDRYYSFEIHPAEAAFGVPLTIKPPIFVPSLVESFNIGVTAKCENCIANPKSILTVNIQQ